MKHTSQSPEVCPGVCPNAGPRTIIRQPTPTNVPIKNGPEIIDFTPVLEVPAAFWNRRMYRKSRGKTADFARATERLWAHS